MIIPSNNNPFKSTTKPFVQTNAFLNNLSSSNLFDEDDTESIFSSKQTDDVKPILNNTQNIPNSVNPLANNDKELKDVFSQKSASEQKSTPPQNENTQSASEEYCESGSHSQKENEASETNSTSMYKIDKATKFTKISKDKTKIIRPNSPLSTSKLLKSKLVPTEGSTKSAPKQGVHKEEILTKDKLVNNLNGQSNIVTTSTDLNSKFEKILHEIKELKQSKALLETQYKEELIKVKLYEKELTELRTNSNTNKLKEIKENEEMLKLEIKNLQNNVAYRIKENELLSKQNEDSTRHIAKLHEYLREYLENKKVSPYPEQDEKIRKGKDGDYNIERGDNDYSYSNSENKIENQDNEKFHQPEGVKVTTSDDKAASLFEEENPDLLFSVSEKSCFDDKSKRDEESRLSKPTKGHTKVIGSGKEERLISSHFSR